MKIIDLCLKHSRVLNLLTFLTILVGSYIAINMNREAYPTVDFDLVTIKTIYPGASPKEVELYVTNPIESEIVSVDNIAEVHSQSIESLSLITAKLDPDLSESDKQRTINQLQKAIDRLRDLPKSIAHAPELSVVDSGELPIIEIALTGDLNYHQLHTMADELTEKIRKLPDAKEPIRYGYYKKEYWVELDPQKLGQNHIGIPEIINALNKKNINLPGGVLKSAQGEFLVRTIGEVRTAEEIDNIVIRTSPSNVNLFVKDVGKTRVNFEEANVQFRTNGKPSINLIVLKKKSGDIIRLVNETKALVNQYQNEERHKSLEVSYINDMSLFVKNRLGLLLDNGIMGIVLVLLCLFLFLSKGIALVTVLGMPVALLGAIAVMNLLGMTINLLTLFAMVIVLGMLVDDAIIVSENIWSHYEKGKAPLEACIEGTREVIWPVTSTVLTTIAAFSPLLVLDGIFGKFIASLPKVVIICLVISLIEAMFILPSHAYDILKFNHWRRSGNKDLAKTRQRKAIILEKIMSFYLGSLNLMLRRRYLFSLALLLVLCGAVWVQRQYLKTVLFPDEGIEVFYLRLETDPGTSLNVTKEKTEGFERLIKEKIPSQELRNFISYIGLQQTDTIDLLKAHASHVAQIAVYLCPEVERKRNADEIIASLRHDAGKLGDKLGFRNITFLRQHYGPPMGKPVEIRIYGKDFQSLSQSSYLLKQALAGMPGVSDIIDDFVPGKEELQVQINEQKARRALLSTEDVALHLRSALTGHIATYVHDKGKRVPVRVKFNEDHRMSLSSLAESPISNGLGHLLPMNSVAKFSSGPGINTIKHRDGSRLITLTAELDENLSSSSEINRKLAPIIEHILRNTPGLEIEQEGEYMDTRRSMKNLAISFCFALAMIFIILTAQFKSLTQPIVVMTAIPFGFIGVVAALYLHGLPISFLAVVGMIGLSGVVVNDSIVLVDFINKERERGKEPMPAILSASKKRFRAVWLTSITTVFGLLPLAYGIGGHDAFLKPAAMVLAYGLIFSTVLILIFVPVLYLIRIDLIKFCLGFYRHPA